MIGSMIRAMSKQMQDMYGAVMVVPVLPEQYDYRIDKTLGWIDSISYVFLRALLVYIAFHFLVKYW